MNDELMAYLISACQSNSEAMALLPAAEGDPARFRKLLTDRYRGRDAIAKAARADKYANYVGPSSVRKVDSWMVHYKELVREIEKDEGRDEDLYKKSKKLLRLLDHIPPMHALHNSWNILDDKWTWERL